MVTREEYSRLTPSQKLAIASISGVCGGRCKTCPFKTAFGRKVTRKFISGYTATFDASCLIQLCAEDTKNPNTTISYS